MCIASQGWIIVSDLAGIQHQGGMNLSAASMTSHPLQVRTISTDSATALRRIAVVTPYYKEDLHELWLAHQSVIGQNAAVTHIMVADGHPNSAVATWSCQHLILPNSHQDAGNFARGAGALHAFQGGAECVCFLDADNWLEPNHVSSLFEVILRESSDIGVSRRTLRRLDGTVLDPLDQESDGQRFADTGTVMLRRSAIDIAVLWTTLPRELGGAGDQIIWGAVNSRGFKITRTGLPTLNYKTKWAVHYRGRGEEPPSGAVDLTVVQNSERYWQSLPDADKRKILMG